VRRSIWGIGCTANEPISSIICRNHPIGVERRKKHEGGQEISRYIVNSFQADPPGERRQITVLAAAGQLAGQYSNTEPSVILPFELIFVTRSLLILT
jgi:hypothetical protein